MSNAISQLVQNASHTAVSTHLTDLKEDFKAGRLLKTDNPMGNGSVDFVDQTYSAAQPAVISARPVPHKVGEFVAASTFGHVFDAYRNFSSACNAMLRGDTSSSIHLGYYSELRSAMALLACDGIGVFNEKHIGVEIGGNGIPLAGVGTTHTFCWKAYSAWSMNPNAQSLLTTINIDGASLKDWLSNFPSTQTTRMEINAYLSTIGLDLRYLSDLDREGRGRVSYRPRCIEGVSHTIPKDDLDCIKEILASLSGSSGPINSQLIIYLLCHILRESFRNRTGDHPNSSQNAQELFTSQVEKMVERMSPSSSTMAVIREYCLDFPLRPIPVISRAIVRDSLDASAVLARAALLSFHAVLHVRMLLDESNVHWDDLSKWWREELEAVGATQPGVNPDPGDVVEDTAESLNSLLSIDEPIDRRSLWDSDASELVDGCRCERIAVAGLFA